MSDSSILSDAMLWTPQAVAELQQYYVDAPDLGQRTFLEKLHEQLAPCTPRAHKLAAEMLWVLMLFPVARAVGADTKREIVEKVWRWSRDAFPASSPMMQLPLEGGVGNPGTAFNTRRWAELGYMVRVAGVIKAQGAEERADLLGDPWKFGALLDQVSPESNPQLRHILKFLLFPDSYEPIATGRDKHAVLKAFKRLPPGPASRRSFTELDRSLLALRGELESQYPAMELSFYREPLRSVWREQKDESEESEVGFWKIAPGDNARLWEPCRDGGYIAIGWDEFGDASGLSLAEYQRRRDDYLRRHPEYPPDRHDQVWKFAQIAEGDRVIANRGTDTVLGIGTVTGPYYFVPGEEYGHRLPVHWDDLTPRTVDQPGWRRTLIKLSEAQFARLVGQAESPEPARETPAAREPAAQYDAEQALDELFIEPQQLERIMDALARRKNLILQGPPGVGKTFFSRRLAYALMGERDKARVGFVQFHPTYAYEDFVQGYRPTGAGFELQNGLFVDFARKAAADPTRPYVFIIDEINRAHLSKVFGELMMLIEADKRGPEWGMPLAYSRTGEPPFHVPDNLYLIGLMNTADRSLAMVDYALRRRFAFIDLEPGFETAQFRRNLEGREAEPELIDRVVKDMVDLNREIAADAANLGRGFCIGHSFFCGRTDEAVPGFSWYRTIVRDEVLPLLREYWPESGDAVARWEKRLLA